jgi:hypothetical protein
MRKGDHMMFHYISRWKMIFVLAGLLLLAQGCATQSARNTPAVSTQSAGSSVDSDPQNQKDALVQELYIKSGLQKQFEQLPLALQAAFDQGVLKDDQVRKLPGNLVSAMRTLAREAFAPESMKAALFKEQKEKLTVQEMKQVLGWLDSPLGKKCTRMEEAASTPEAFVEMEQYAARMQASPPPADRLRVLQKLDTAVKATETGVEIAVSTQVALALAVISTLPLERQRSIDDIVREIEKSRPLVEGTVRAGTLVSLLYTYRDLSDAEIQRYIDFAVSPVGSKFQSVCMTALKKAFFDCSVKWGKAIGEAIKQMKTQKEA